MSRRKKPVDIDDGIAGDAMVPFLEQAVKDVIQNADATPADITKAIEAGVRLCLAKHKTRSSSDKSFFGTADS